MIFQFLRYLQPTHYFSLRKNKGQTVFPVYTHLPEAIKAQLIIDEAYTSDIARQYDLSWQALYKGYVGTTETITDVEELPLLDNYIFIRKYFSPFWVFYVLCFRLLSFNNPFSEISYWIKTRHVKRSLYLKNPILYQNWESFNSNLIKKAPLISIVIPTLNRYCYLKDVLRDFEKQDYTNFEVIVVDQSDDFNIDFYNDFNLDIHVVKQEEKALWLARNTAIKRASGELIAFSEDDVRINTDWITSHLKCLDFFKADISAGVFYPEGQTIPKDRSFFMIASQFATGNAMLYKKVFNTIGLFDRQFEKQRMGDGEFGLRLYLNGFKSISNPKASCIDVKAEVGGLRDMGSWDAFRTQNWFSPRPIPSVLYFFRRYFGDQAARLALLRTVPLSMMPYQFKTNKPMMILGVFVTLLLTPLVLFQVFKSWQLSSKKLKHGAMIERLDD